MGEGRIERNIVDLHAERIYFGEVRWRDGRIEALIERGGERSGVGYLAPGFIDAHVHVESSMLPPAEFGRIAVRHGTVAAVCDPHEIANVLGEHGVRWMLEEAREAPCKLFFGVPSCVPATPFETAGATLGVEEIESLLADPAVVCLAEMMNFPGVLAGDESVMAKLAIAARSGLPVDGHAPGLRGEAAARYAAAGIGTDHECVALDEAHDKLAAGIQVLIREGSAARDYDALHPLLGSHPAQVMFCSDDKHPDDLLAGHIDRLAARALAQGYRLWDVLRAACVNPVLHYRLPVGLLRVGDAMDAVELSDLRDLRVTKTWIAGRSVAEHGVSLTPARAVNAPNRFEARRLTPEVFRITHSGGLVRVIGVADGQLVTRSLQLAPALRDGILCADPERDIAWLCVVNRYRPEPPAVALVQGFGLATGAMASSVAHDSHNVVAVGAAPEALCRAVNAVVEAQGGIAIATDSEVDLLPLPIAGLMSSGPGDWVAARYESLDRAAKQLGSPLHAPFMTLSFLALLVIPTLKLSDRGLFDGHRFEFVPLTLE